MQIFRCQVCEALQWLERSWKAITRRTSWYVVWHFHTSLDLRNRFLNALIDDRSTANFIDEWWSWERLSRCWWLTLLPKLTPFQTRDCAPMIDSIITPTSYNHVTTTTKVGNMIFRRQDSLGSLKYWCITCYAHRWAEGERCCGHILVTRHHIDSPVETNRLSRPGRDHSRMARTKLHQ